MYGGKKITIAIIIIVIAIIGIFIYSNKSKKEDIANKVNIIYEGNDENFFHEEVTYDENGQMVLEQPEI